MNVQVRWSAIKNSEREVIRKHGDVWQVSVIGTFKGEKSWLIKSPDGTDERWITPEQVLKSI